MSQAWLQDSQYKLLVCHVRWKLVTARLHLKNLFQSTVGLYTILSQISLGIRDVILPDVAFLIDNSWLVKMQVCEKVCVT